MKKTTTTKKTEVNGKPTKAYIRTEKTEGAATTQVQVGMTTLIRNKAPQNEYEQRQRVEETAETEEERIYNETRA